MLGVAKAGFHVRCKISTRSKFENLDGDWKAIFGRVAVLQSHVIHCLRTVY